MAKEKTSARPKYNVGQNVAYMIRLARRETKTVLPMAAAQIVLDVALAVLELLAAPSILRCLEDGGAMARLTGTILTFTLALMLVDAARSYLDENVAFGRIQARSCILERMHAALCRTSYPNTLDPAYLDRMEKAFMAGNSSRSSFEAIWTTLVSLAASILSFCIWLAMLSALPPVLLFVIVVTSGISYVISVHTGGWEYRHRDEEARLSHELQYIENRQGDVTLGKDLRIFGLGSWLTELEQKALRLCGDFYRRAERMHLCADAADVLLTLARNGFAYVWLLARVAAGRMTASEFLLYFSAVSGFAAHVSSILKHMNELNRQSRDISLAREAMEEQGSFRFEGGAAVPRPADGKYTLELRDVSFRYPGSEKVIFSHLNLIIPAGEKLAVVGLNGQGKTTLVKLLGGFLDPDEGAVLLNGQDIRQFDRREYYKLFSSVFQDFSLLAGTIEENVTQQPQELDAADHARVRDCLRLAGLEEKIRRLPDGVDTLLGRQVYNEAIQLSGGETQRLLLARALYKDSPIIMLDEPTAALDPIAESDLYQKYNALSAGRTSIYISHRLASTRFCDRILLLGDGGVLESGTHDELMARGGRYAELFAVQSRYYQTSEGGIQNETAE